MKTLKRLYDWVLHWANTPYGTPALFVLAFAESSLFPIPPDILLMALGLSIPRKSMRYALICSIGSVLGGVLGYTIGFFGYEAVGKPIIELYQGQEVMDKVKALYDQWGFWGVLTAAITPIPYKVFTISSGFFRFDFWPFLAASVIGRSFRFFLVSGLIYHFGPSIKTFIDRYFNVLSVAFMVLLIGGFLLLKYAF